MNDGTPNSQDPNIPAHWGRITSREVYNEITEWITQHKNEPLPSHFNSSVIKFYYFFVDNKNEKYSGFRMDTVFFIVNNIESLIIPHGITYYWLDEFQNFKIYFDKNLFIMPCMVEFIERNEKMNDTFIKMIWTNYVNETMINEHIDYYNLPFYKSICELIRKLEEYRMEIVVDKKNPCFKYCRWFLYNEDCYNEKKFGMHADANRHIWCLFRKSSYYHLFHANPTMNKKRKNESTDEEDDIEFKNQCKTICGTFL